ncbi:signal recognition particle-docking protein FtsY [Kineosporia sp. J2-2]|uniref:Signal recognition particle receptor FtsY n=1 Tax=Kineosporia corallincola TaxID=2835133 RepID=A0ABS5TFE7_9ACTN|nr:signal recognition particle-docking protein FtsY [Kineosporia corallincola]MBT0769791.1 signal recognition particle-docking protein FtsY [Kineosporia corallincola]
MDTVQWIILIAIVALAALGSTVGLLAGRGRKQPPLPPGAADTTTLERRPSATDEGDAETSGAVDVLEPTAPVETTPATPVAEPEVTEPEILVPDLERPEAPRGRLVRLRARLARSNALGRGLLELLSRDKLDADTWDEIEETLLMADLGVDPTTELVDRLRERVTVLGVRDVDQVRGLLREELKALVDPGEGLDRSLAVDHAPGRPAVVMVVGVNGTGKTTTVGKLARVLVAEDKDVVLGAADTFRAAAADQLATWGDRVGVPTIRSDRDGADPASVAFDAVKAGIETEADVVLIDTAGRLQNKVGLMDELGKVKRVVEKHGPVDEVLLVLDATTGQNGMQQAKVFSEVVNITGIVLTKLDGTAKGGIVVAVQRTLGVPVKLIGLGEGPDDLAPFDPDAFVDALLA